MGVAERNPQPGGHLVHDATKAGGGSALPIATTHRLTDSDDECPHTATMGGTGFTGLKVALRQGVIDGAAAVRQEKRQTWHQWQVTIRDTGSRLVPTPNRGAAAPWPKRRGIGSRLRHRSGQSDA